METKANTPQGKKSQEKVDKKVNSTPPKKAETPLSAQSSKTSVATDSKSREEILAEREAKKKAKQAAKKKGAGEAPETENHVVAQLPPKSEEKPIDSQPKPQEKSREEILAEREAKKKMKQAAKNKEPQESPQVSETVLVATTQQQVDKPKEDIIAEREAKKKAKQAAKQGGKVDPPAKENDSKEANTQVDSKKAEEKSKAELRAERRAKQEAQRAAKEKMKAPPEPKETPKTEKVLKPHSSPKTKEKKAPASLTLNRVKLFSHLNYEPKPSLDAGSKIHPAIIKLGAKYSARIVNGSNARCVAFLQALRQVILDYETPPEKVFWLGLESEFHSVMEFLQKCRPISVSMTNALRHIKSHLTQLPSNVSDDEAKSRLKEVIDTYINDQIFVAGVAICNSVQKKISNGDQILIYSCSSLVFRLLLESHKEGTEFSVVVVDGGPWYEGREMLRRLTSHGIKATYVLINAVGFIMRQATKVLLGAHALLANGYVMSRAGSSMVALMAHACNVPVLVCCETHKFSERVQTDSFVFNELGNPDELAQEDDVLANWKSNPYLSLLSLVYDVTPPDLVTGVVTELAILPCTSVPVVLRIKPSDVAS